MGRKRPDSDTTNCITRSDRALNAQIDVLFEVPYCKSRHYSVDERLVIARLHGRPHTQARQLTLFFCFGISNKIGLHYTSPDLNWSHIRVRGAQLVRQRRADAPPQQRTKSVVPPLMRCGSCAKRPFRQYACLVRARSTFRLTNLRASRMENGQPRTPIAVPGRNALDGECPNTNSPLMHPTHPSSLHGRVQRPSSSVAFERVPSTSYASHLLRAISGTGCVTSPTLLLQERYISSD